MALAGFVTKQIVFKFRFTCGDYTDSVDYCHSQLCDTRLLLLLPSNLADKIVKYW